MGLNFSFCNDKKQTKSDKRKVVVLLLRGKHKRRFYYLNRKRN